MHSNRRRLVSCAGLLVLLPALLLGCGPKATVGGLAGGAGGGLLAAAITSNPAGIAAGVILGGLAGGAIGDALDQRDKELAMKAAQQSLEAKQTGSTQAWKNPDSGNSGSFTPTRTYQDGSGQYCREYRQTITVGDKTEKAFGTACRQADGSWKVVK